MGWRRGLVEWLGSQSGCRRRGMSHKHVLPGVVSGIHPHQERWIPALDLLKYLGCLGSAMHAATLHCAEMLRTGSRESFFMAFQYLKGGYKKDGGKLFSRVCYLSVKSAEHWTIWRGWDPWKQLHRVFTGKSDSFVAGYKQLFSVGENLQPHFLKGNKQWRSFDIWACCLRCP